ncbi:MAG: alpha/beta fold hydrolase [Kutzneria sp.]|nr:alpha/beta fold hydrolase [Kutzneria sp.]MBV9843582.1 alpha/beta fold hydrolase [Kutzneria sp.]
MLIVHGILATTAMYEPIAELLSRHYQVVLVERRGYEVSGDGERPATFAMQARDIAAVLEAVGEPSYVFGHSAGGLVALHTLAAGARQVRAMALYEPPASMTGARLLPVLKQCRELVGDGRNADAIVTFLSSVSGPHPSLRQMAEFLERRAYGLIEDLECMTALPAESARWSPGDTPILLLAGSESDQYAEESIAVLQRELPVRDTVVLAGQGHHPSDPEPVAAAVHAFFSVH